MFWRKKVRYDRVRACLDKAGIDETADRKFDGIDMEADMLNLCEKDRGEGAILAQFFCCEEGCRLFCDPETEGQKEKIREICLEAGIAYSIEKDVDMDLPEEERLPQKWTVEIESVHWKGLVCLLMKEVFGAEDFDVCRL